jgi:hypothetical protein
MLDGWSMRIIPNTNESIIRYSVARHEFTATITQEEAIRFCNDFLERLTELSGIDLDFFIVESHHFSNVHLIIYMGRYNGVNIASNIIQFSVDGNGIYEIIYQLAVPEAFTDNTHAIYSTDEALFSLLREFRRVYPDDDIHINDINIAYYSQVDRSGEITTPARPVYMITFNVIDNEGGRTRRHAFVDAYSNEIVTNRITHNELFRF